jgi:hypothetical protein
MKRTFLWLVPVIALSVPATLYFWPETEKHQPETVAAPARAPEPAIRYPVESEPAAESLPPLAESDTVVRDAFIALFGQGLNKLVNFQEIVRRIVATVDNLPHDQMSLQLMPVKPVNGFLLTAKVGENLALSPNNAARYQPYVRLADAVPTDALVALYLRFYPLFQQQYENLGYPDSYFNDRLVHVIDHLLDTPEVQEPVLLTRPNVIYEFDDPYLEGLSVGQKTMLRIGRANRGKLKSKLREIRHVLVSKAPQE